MYDPTLCMTAMAECHKDKRKASMTKPPLRRQQQYPHTGSLLLKL